MKKSALLIVLLLITSLGYSQQERDVKLNEETNLIEATYYHENGVVSQEGTFDLKGKLHGEWISFNEAGEKISKGSYANGVKTGKWYFWNEGIMKEVEFKENAIASVVSKEAASGFTKN